MPQLPIQHIFYVNFLPNDPFGSYVSHLNSEPIIPPEVCKRYDQLMAEAFTVCENDNVDIYELGVSILHPMF